MELLSQNIGISNDPETKGFDLSAGNTWIYPENYPIREYQYNIVKTALYNNTLVCLPTGLGKTFIAAVVMYNFWRWYPFGKIVFLAPTKPLVAQQINACYEIMGIPNIDTMELTGAVNQKNRETAWLKKRIIFATPQVFHNDLEKSIVPSHLVKCIVVDEAHKALGKHSYCECMRMLSIRNQYIRILALSATPGNKIDNVHEVIQNLHISNLELRDENSLDIMPYINKRKIDIILVPLSNELAAFKERYTIIMDRHVRSLIQYNVLRGQTANISKGRIFYLLREFKTKTNKQGNYAQIMKTLNILLTMYHAYELMIRHGLRAFYKFYQSHSDKFWMHNENHLRELLYDIEVYLGPFPDICSSGDISEMFQMPANLVFGHNKFHKLKELLEHHFKNNNSNQKDTRAIVFAEYRDIVNEVYVLLLQSKPIIRPQMFVGQASQKQKQQIKALEDFRSNRVNVLISTSIGEEGLDVGEVDLIICFDVSQHSPIRLVQRMGRTGRKRDGHIIVLVTDGKEHENLKSTLSRRDSLNNKILNTSNIFSSLYQNNPRMIPNQFTPECHKIHIIALPKTSNVKSGKKKKGINKNNEISSIKRKDVSSLMMQKNASQSTMMKFLNNFKCNEQKQDNIYNISNVLTIQDNNAHNTIHASNVKLLSDDNVGIDFLTLCAVKRSEEEMSSKTVHKMDTTYIPTSKQVGDFFNFVVPDVKILDDLSFLNMGLINNLSMQHKNCENIPDNNDYINIDDDNFWYTTQKDKSIDNNRIRFEDILDETTNSDVTTISQLSQKLTDIRIDYININKDHASNIKDAVTTNYTKTELINEDMEPILFENILNDSFNWSEDDLEDGDTVQQNILSPNPLNIFDKNAEKINRACEDAVINSRDKDSDRFNQNLPASIGIEQLDQTNEYAESFANEMQDFNCDIDINEFVCERNNSKAEESMLSITQAIDNIAKIKGDLKKSSESSVSKEKQIDDDNLGWILVNTKYETKIEGKNANLRTKKILPKINRDFIAQSFCAKQNSALLNDSDEDFMITEDNVKRFDELESSYFRNSSEKSINKNSCLYNTWKKSVNSNSSFGNISLRNSETKVYDTSKSLKLHNTLTLTDNKRPELSLKRNKNQYTNAIDTNLFDASTSNRQDESILESSLDTTPQQMSPMDRKIERKIDHKFRHGEKPKNEFIDDEAKASSVSSLDESFTSTEEGDLLNFVSYTQDVVEQKDMHAHYLQSIRSPINKPGAFHFRKPRALDPNVEIYSQPASQIQDSYVYDDFCVSEDVEPSILCNDSILEIAERELEHKKRKRVYPDKNSKQVIKRKRINILDTTTSSEDEIG